MIGRLLVVLLVANAIVFAWGRGWLGSPAGGDREPGMIEQQHDAGRLRSVPLSRLQERDAPKPVRRGTNRADAARTDSARTDSATGAVAPSRPVTGSTPGAGAASTATPTSGSPASSTSTAAPATAPTAPPATTSGPAQPSPGGSPASSSTPSTPDARPGTDGSAANGRSGEIVASVCRAYGPTDEERAARLREALETSGATVDAQRTEQGASYLVFIPPSATFAAAQERLADLRRIGRDDAFLIQDGQYRLGISLGVFRAEGVARAFVAQLAEAGESGAQVAPRPPIQVRVRLQARWNDPGAESMASMLGSQFDLAARECR